MTAPDQAAEQRAADGFRRLHPEDGLFLRAEHLEIIQDAGRDLAEATAFAIGSGVVSGFGVRRSGSRLEVGAGLAMNSRGQLLRAATPMTLDLTKVAVADPATQFLVLQVLPAQRPDGSEAAYGNVCDDPCGASRFEPWTRDGVRLDLREDTLELGSTAAWRRGRLASRWFERERAAGDPWVGPRPAGAAATLVTGRDWETPAVTWPGPGNPPVTGAGSDAVPLAVLLRGPDGWLVDVWTVRREVGGGPSDTAWRMRMITFGKL